MIEKAMSELINHAKIRKEKLKELILQLHEGTNPQQVRAELVNTLQHIPYDEVVEVEQELIQEGLPESEVLRLCDVHGQVLEGHIDQSGAQEIPAGHPLDVFLQENAELMKVIGKTRTLLKQIPALTDAEFSSVLPALQLCFNELSDVDKHYRRKEYLLFPYLEKNNITGPPKVMWGKHDEIREQLSGCIDLLRTAGLQKQDMVESLTLLFHPVLDALADMTVKEEEILFPMAMDLVTEPEWWAIHQQTLEFGFTLIDPVSDWKPEGLTAEQETSVGTMGDGVMRLPSGSFTAAEIQAILNTAPFDMTFVDKNDKVKYFTQGKERIFTRNRSIINRDVRLCHPPGSVHIVEKILEDFKSGKASRAPFWIQMKGKFILIEYFALRDEDGEYLGTLEVSQDLTEQRKLEGEQRILSYSEKD